MPHHCYLHVYAAAFGPRPAALAVLADRTQVPSGAGYALENRIVISRMLPNIYHGCQVQRLAPFFMTPPRHAAVRLLCTIVRIRGSCC